MSSWLSGAKEDDIYEGLVKKATIALLLVFTLLVLPAVFVLFLKYFNIVGSNHRILYNYFCSWFENFC